MEITTEFTARTEVYVRLQAMFFAFLERTSVIGIQDLHAAIHWLDYATESVEPIFDDR